MLRKKICKIAKIVDSINFEHNILLENLEIDNKLTVFLTGKSGSGKTMLLNALLNLDDEFYISSKVSTLTQFRISLGNKFEYSFHSNSNFQEFPEDVEERKQKLKELNESNKIVYIHNSDSILKYMNFIDIPGFFDYRNNNEFLFELFTESDLVLFFKPYNEMITPEEKQFLDSLTEKYIQYCILFTKIDITNRVEGLTQKTIPDFVKDRSNSYGNYLNYFLISAKKYKETIDELKKYLISNYLDISSNSITNKIERVKRQYITSINDYKRTLLNKINLEVEREKDVFDKNQIEIQIKMIEKKEILEIKITDNKNNLFKNINRMLNSNRGNVEELQNLWIRFWGEIKEYLENDFSISDFHIPDLPYIDKEIFEEMMDLEDLIKFLNSNNSDEKKEEKELEERKNENKKLFSKAIESIKNKQIPEKGLKSVKIYLKRENWQKQMKAIVNTKLERIVTTISASTQKQRKEFNEESIKKAKIEDSEIPKLEKALENLEKIDVIG